MIITENLLAKALGGTTKAGAAERLNAYQRTFLNLDRYKEREAEFKNEQANLRAYLEDIQEHCPHLEETRVHEGDSSTFHCDLCGNVRSYGEAPNE